MMTQKLLFLSFLLLFTLSSEISAQYGTLVCSDLYTRLHYGDIASINDSDPSPANMRSDPSLQASLTQEIPAGELVVIVGGPACADGWVWWEAVYMGERGWIAEVDNRNLYNLLPYAPAVFLHHAPENAPPGWQLSWVYVMEDAYTYTSPSINSQRVDRIIVSGRNPVGGLVVEGKNGNSMWLEIFYSGGTNNGTVWICRDFTIDSGNIFLVPITDESMEDCFGNQTGVSENLVVQTVAEALQQSAETHPEIQEYLRDDVLLIIEATADVIDIGFENLSDFDIVCGAVTYTDYYDRVVGTSLSENGWIQAGDFACTWVQAGSVVLLGSNPVALVPILLEPEFYVDPWLDPINEAAWSFPITCTLFPEAPICP